MKSLLVVLEDTKIATKLMKKRYTCCSTYIRCVVHMNISNHAFYCMTSSTVVVPNLLE